MGWILNNYSLVRIMPVLSDENMKLIVDYI